MILKEAQEQFIRSNQQILVELFNQRIDELKEQMLTASKEDRDRICDLILELKEWLTEIKIFTGDKEVKKDNFV